MIKSADLFTPIIIGMRISGEIYEEQKNKPSKTKPKVQGEVPIHLDSNLLLHNLLKRKKTPPNKPTTKPRETN